MEDGGEVAGFIEKQYIAISSLLFVWYRGPGAHIYCGNNFQSSFRAQKCKVVGHALFQYQLSTCYDCSRQKRSCNTQDLRLPKVRRDTAHFLAQLSNTSNGTGVSFLDLRRILILNLVCPFVHSVQDAPILLPASSISRQAPQMATPNKRKGTSFSSIGVNSIVSLFLVLEVVAVPISALEVM